MKEARGIEGGEGSDQGVGVGAVDASEKVAERVPVACESEGGEDGLNAGSEGFASRRVEPWMEALPEGSEGSLFDDGGREILVERGALIDDGEAGKGGVGRVGQEALRGGSKHVSETDVHVDLDGGRGLLASVVGGASGLSERVEGALRTGRAEELANRPDGSESLG